MPDAVAGEFGFAASGTCLVTSGGRDAWFGSGGGASRVFHSRDGGLNWTAVAAPIPAAAAGGVFSLAFRNPREGVIVGGDFTAPDNGVDASGFTRDGGATWTGGGDLSGYRSGVDWVTFAHATLIAVGPTGSDISFDGGRNWKAFDECQLRRRRLRAVHLLGEWPIGRGRRARPLNGLAQRALDGARHLLARAGDDRVADRLAPAVLVDPLGLEAEITEHDGVVDVRRRAARRGGGPRRAGRGAAACAPRRPRSAGGPPRRAGSRAARTSPTVGRRRTRPRSGARRASPSDGTRSARPGSGRAPPRGPARQALSRTSPGGAALRRCRDRPRPRGRALVPRAEAGAARGPWSTVDVVQTRQDRR